MVFPKPWLTVQTYTLTTDQGERSGWFLTCHRCGGTTDVTSAYEAAHPGTYDRTVETHNKCARMAAA